MTTRTTNELVTALRSVRANMLGTDDERHYWDCQDAADELIRLKKIIDDYAAICQSYEKDNAKRCISNTDGAK